MRAPEAGLTLIEVLVSLTIAAAVGVAGFSTLDAVLRVSARGEGRLEALREIDRALLLLGRDAAQVDAAALALAEGALALPDAGGGHAATWQVEDGALVRRVEMADRDGPPVAQRMIPDVASAAWRVLGADGWREAWPPPAAEETLRAVELTLSLADAGGSVTRLWEVPEGPPPGPPRIGGGP